MDEHAQNVTIVRNATSGRQRPVEGHVQNGVLVESPGVRAGGQTRHVVRRCEPVENNDLVDAHPLSGRNPQLETLGPLRVCVPRLPGRDQSAVEIGPLAVAVPRVKHVVERLAERSVDRDRRTGQRQGAPLPPLVPEVTGREQTVDSDRALLRGPVADVHWLHPQRHRAGLDGRGAEGDWEHRWMSVLKPDPLTNLGIEKVRVLRTPRVLLDEDRIFAKARMAKRDC